MSDLENDRHNLSKFVDDSSSYRERDFRKTLLLIVCCAREVSHGPCSQRAINNALELPAVPKGKPPPYWGFLHTVPRDRWPVVFLNLFLNVSKTRLNFSYIIFFLISALNLHLFLTLLGSPVKACATHAQQKPVKREHCSTNFAPGSFGGISVKITPKI